jgi:hypothetical protein
MPLRALLSAPPWLRLRQHGARYLWLGLFMGVAIFVSLKTGEHYPFSHFPMYGNPNPKPVDYYFLTDATGQPLPVVDLTGDTAPKLKKRLNTQLNEWGFANNTRIKSEIPPDVRARLTKEVLDSFVAQSKHRGTPLPNRVQLWRGEIHTGPDGYHETFVKEAEN